MSSGTLAFKQNNDDSAVIYLTQVAGSTVTPLNLTGLQSATMRIIDGATTIDELDIGDGLSIVSATGGSIRAAFSPSRLATAGNFVWEIVLEWTNGTGPLTWPLSGSRPRMIVHPAPIPMTGSPARIYYGVGIAGLTEVSTLGYDDLHSSLDFTTPALAPTAQKAYVGYPAAWGYAHLSIVGVDQTAAFTRSTVTVSAVQYYLYESTQLLTTTGLEIVATS